MDKREPITDSNLGPAVSVLTWITVASVVIAVGIKVTLSTVVLRKRIAEDTALFLATAFSIGFTVSTSLAVANGIGRHQATLSPYQLKALQKAFYSTSIFLILVSSCAQASVVIFFHEITPYHLHQRLIQCVAGVISLFFLASFFVVIFPCHPPNVWEVLGVRCIDQPAFWEAYTAVNLVIESTLVLFPVLMVYPLTMEKRRKAIVITGFAARLTVIGAFAAQLYEARSLKAHLDDWTFHTWKHLLAMVFVQGLSIITVCIPYIRNMLLSMESGMIQTGHFRLLNRHSLETAIPLRHIHIDSTSTNSFGNVDTQLQQPAACYGEKGTHK